MLGHKVKLLATITKVVAGEKTKTLNTAQTLQISTQANAQEGLESQLVKQISLKLILYSWHLTLVQMQQHHTKM